MISSKSRLIGLFRLLAVALCGFLRIFQHKVDDGISLLWRVLLDNRVFQHESFEVRKIEGCDVLLIILKAIRTFP